MTRGAAHWLCHEGISAARLRVVYKGRPASIDATKVAALKAEGLGPPRSRSASRSGGPLSIACFCGGAAGGVSTRGRSRRRVTGAGRRVLTRWRDTDVVSFRGQLQSLSQRTQKLAPSLAQAAANMRRRWRAEGGDAVNRVVGRSQPENDRHPTLASATGCA
jgi:hypothetical protein